MIMKRILMILCLLSLTFTLTSQDITGQWNGLLELGKAQLTIVFHIDKSVEGYTATMDSPDQGAKGIEVTSVTFESPVLKLEVSKLKMEYTGEYTDGIFKGTFKQGGFTAPLNLTRENVVKRLSPRPQDPKKPYPYHSEDVIFPNDEAGITLAGTLTFPKKPGKYPAVVLISGSGPQNRDEEILNHRTFLVLSDYLTRRGIAVLRYDDRGTAQSTGDFSTATTYDLSTDAEAAIRYLQTRPEVDTSQLGLVGHSEGGIIAPMVATRNEAVAYIVLLAGTGIPGDQLLLVQMELIGRASGMEEEKIAQTRELNHTIFNMVKKMDDQEELNTQLETYIRKVMKENPELEKPEGISEEELIQMAIERVASPWMKSFIRHDPAPVLEKVRVPVLAVNGVNDLQVPARMNLEAIEEALRKGGNDKVTIKEYKKLNHLFQKSKTGLPAEYGEIKQTFSPKVMKDVAKWILSTGK